MADITVQRGQGVTQAIADNLGLSKSDCRKINLSIWQEVMTLVDRNNSQALKNNQPPTFTGTNDVHKIGNKSSYHTNFVVHEGQQMQIDDTIWGKIKHLLTSKSLQNTKSESSNSTAPKTSPIPSPAAKSTAGVSVSSGTTAADETHAVANTSTVKSENPNLTLEQNEALHKEVVDKSVKFIEENFSGSPLEKHFSSEEDRALFLQCLHEVKYNKEATGAGHAEKGVIYIETNNAQVNSDSEMTKLLIHEANHAFLQKKAIANSTLNFPTKAEEIECETLALTAMSHFVKNCGMEDYKIYGRNISDFTDKSTVQNDREFKNWLNGYQQLADNLQGDITIMHSPYRNIGNSAQIHIKSGDIVRVSGQEPFEIGKTAFLEGVDDTSVAQLIMHRKDFSDPDCSLAPGKIVFDALGATSAELASAIDENFDKNDFDLILVTIERINPKTGQLEIVYTAKAYKHK